MEDVFYRPTLRNDPHPAEPRRVTPGGIPTETTDQLTQGRMIGGFGAVARGLGWSLGWSLGRGLDRGLGRGRDGLATN